MLKCLILLAVLGLCEGFLFHDVLTFLKKDQQDPANVCYAPADYIFVLDGSGTVTSPNFEMMKNSVVQSMILARATVPNMRFGVVVYSTGVRQDGIIELTSSDILNQVRSLHYPSLGTETHLGINEAVNMFSRNKRPGVMQVLHLITGSLAQLPGEVVKEANVTQSNDIYVLATGITEMLSVASHQSFNAELMSITLSQDELSVLARFDSLGNKLLTIMQSFSDTCVGDISFVAKDCKNQIDIIFVIDGSDRVGAFNFDTVKSSVLTFVTSSKTMAPTARIGVIVYSTVVNQSGIIEITSASNVINRIDDLPYPANNSDTYVGINESIQMFTRNKISGVPQIMIVITDGISENQTKTENAAKQARDDGINLFSTGVFTGSSSSERVMFNAELAAIASSANQSVQLDDFNLLTDTVLGFLPQICMATSTSGSNPGTGLVG